MTLKKRKSDAGKIEPGMKVEATQGDLGEADVSKPKVTGVAQDEQGNAGKLVVEKGVIFKKKLEIPADRVESDEKYLLRRCRDIRLAGRALKEALAE